ncbi:dioxygenase family protein [Asticcacaulis solisilvae]|uniref:dioxygenase family protein n=1 Tax=Asticcacaulis solisilvae TaxID=1217274 RepID=UPI003FD76E60
MKRRTFLTSAFLGAGAAVLPPQGQASTPAAAGELTAQTTEGPYYLGLDLMRADITEGLKGFPLDVVFTVLDPQGRPCAGALVDIWHCNAEGDYSGFDKPGVQGRTGTTYLRGTQTAGADGTVTFHSLYPGWYQGRTTHIHFKVRSGKLTNLTSQFFLPDTLSEFLYTQVSAYHRTALRDTLNSTDGIAIAAGTTVEGNVREARGRYVASLTVRVDPAANPPVDRPPAPGQMPDGLAGLMPPPMDGKGPGQMEKGRPFGPPPGMKALEGEKRIAALLPDAERSAAMPPIGGPRMSPKA